MQEAGGQLAGRVDACTEHTECAAGLCLDGTCPAEGDILWVDGDAACDDAGSGTSAAPFCEIQAALDNGSAELIAVRERSDTGRFARPIRSVFHRTDGGAVLAVVTEYASWNHSGNNNNNLRLDPGLFRPPKDAATRCVHDDSGELSKSLEHRNTLHFNPLYYPRVGGGKQRGDSNEDDNKKLNRGGTGSSGSSPMGSRRGEGTARRRVVANKDGSKPAAPWESHGVDPADESKSESGNPDAKTQTGEVKTGSSTRSYSDLLPPGTATSDGNKGGGYLSDRGWVDAGIVDGIPESKDDGSGPPHEYALLGSGSDEL